MSLLFDLASLEVYMNGMIHIDKLRTEATADTNVISGQRCAKTDVLLDH